MSTSHMYILGSSKTQLKGAPETQNLKNTFVCKIYIYWLTVWEKYLVDVPMDKMVESSAIFLPVIFLLTGSADRS